MRVLMRYLACATSFGVLDLSVDEMMQEILDAVKRTGAKRLVIDSLAGFEMALAPSFRSDFRESLYRMIFALTAIGITILSTLEMPETFTEPSFSSYSISFLTDDIIRMRYVEIDGELCQIMMVSKCAGPPQPGYPEVSDHHRRHRHRRAFEELCRPHHRNSTTAVGLAHGRAATRQEDLTRS
jgi:KaiC/GvpD/RAD55 family RecA-like ATPase